MAEGRVGLNFTIENFVVAEDKSLGARLERLRARSLWRWKRARVRLRKAAHRIGLDRLGSGIARSRDGARSLGHAALLLGLILRYAFARPLHASEVEHPERGRYRKPAIILGLSVLALGFALLLPEREILTPEPIVSSAEASTTVPKPQPEASPAETRRAPDVPLPPEQRPWQPVRQPMALYNLESPELSGLAVNYRVSQRGASRQDTLLWQPRAEAGEGDLRRSAALIVVERHEGTAPTEKPLFADLASRAAEHG